MTARRVLMVVDDDPSVLLLVDVLAERLGFRVKAVTSGLQALEQIRDYTLLANTGSGRT
jgi:CheY-like chemotaxis protein